MGMPLSHGSRMANIMVRYTICQQHAVVICDCSNLLVAAFTSVALTEQWPGVSKAAETVSSLNHLQ